MKAITKSAILAVLAILLPFFSNAQENDSSLTGLRGVLAQLYDEMLPLCSQLMGVGQAIAGFAATWYIGSRVWKHIASAEPVDFYPLFRPFVLGFCIMIFPSVLGVINGIMKPTVTATASVVSNSNASIEILLQRKKEALMESSSFQMYAGDDLQGNRDMWYRYTHENADPSEEGILEGIGNDVKFAMAKASFQFRFMVKEWLSELLTLLFETASLLIDSMRTFQLIVLAILGPLVFGLAVFDGFEFTLTSWLARYINIFLWLPVANIFGGILGKIQEQMLKVDLAEIDAYGDTMFNQTDIGYLIFLIIGIVGYVTVPSTANYIVQAGFSPLTQKVTGLLGRANPVK